MARIAQEVIEQVKQDISLLRLVENSGVTLKQHGKDYIGHCPFHNDKTPSFVVSPETNLWNCLGACGEGGSVIDWVMKTQGVSFKHAVELLRKDNLPSFTQSTRSAHGVGSAAQPLKQSTVPKLPSPVTTEADDQVMLQQVIDYYHQTLKEAPEVQDYLAKRGLDDAELINHFKLGYANRTLGLRLPHKNRKAGHDIREQLQRIGLYRDNGREHFNGSLVIPVMDENGLIQEVYGRKLLDNLRKGTPKHTYLPGPHAGVFNIAGLANTEEVILCESLIDALTFWRCGFRHVTTSYGVNGFTDEILQAFVDNNIKRVLIAYDRDEAGNKAAVALAAKLNQQGMACHRILFPKNMDANAYACQVTPATKSLALAIRKAEWLGSGAGTQRLDTGDKQQDTEEAKEKEAQPSEEIPMPTPETKTNEITITLGDRLYRIRGLDKNTSGEQLKINLMVKKGESFHMDKLDLYSAKQRQVFINQASLELVVKEDVIKADLGKLLLKLETIQEQQTKDDKEPLAKPLSSAEQQAAMTLLRSPDLLDRILTDFTTCGVVGEETNKLVGYLACVSRKLDKPLAVIIQSSSAAGKSSLMEAILALMPEEERVQYSAMTGQSLFYMGETNLKHKILAIAEEEGAHNASYALKLLQSEGEITIASTGKDETTGSLVTKEYKVEGPVMLFLTTTAIEIDEELLNRCLVLTVNESREQTQAIHRLQRSRRTLAGLHAKLAKDQLLNLHRNAQQLLRPLAVINPYADQLTFLDDKTRTRRDHEKYLALIDSIALLHQYQREIKILQQSNTSLEYIEVTLADIETANRLAHEVLGKTLDELPPQTRTLLKQMQVMVKAECKAQSIEKNHYRFSRKAIREKIGWTYDQVRVHLARLVSMEYVLVHRGGRGQSFEYELLYDGNPDTDEVHAMGLLSIEQLEILKTTLTTTSLGGQTGQFGVPLGPHWGGVGKPGKTLQPKTSKTSSQTVVENEKRIVLIKNNTPSYLHEDLAFCAQEH